MKNQLIPIKQNNGGEYQPCLVSQGYKAPKILNVDGALRLKNGEAIEELTFRNDLSGLVQNGGYLPVLQSEGGQIYFVKNPTDYVVAAFEEAQR